MARRLTPRSWKTDGPAIAVPAADSPEWANKSHDDRRHGGDRLAPASDFPARANESHGDRRPCPRLMRVGHSGHVLPVSSCLSSPEAYGHCRGHIIFMPAALVEVCSGPGGARDGPGRGLN